MGCALSTVKSKTKNIKMKMKKPGVKIKYMIDYYY